MTIFAKLIIVKGKKKVITELVRKDIQGKKRMAKKKLPKVGIKTIVHKA